MAVETTGYKRRTYDEILSGLEADARKLFGEDIDTSDLSVLGKYLRIIAYRSAKSEEDKEKLYYGGFVTTANDSALDMAAGYALAVRNGGAAARHRLTVRGPKGTVIPYGTKFRTEADVLFFNTHEETVGEDGTAILVVECTQVGEVGNLAAENLINSLAEQNAALLGVEVEASELLAQGSAMEDDFTFRRRIMSIIKGRGSKTIASIRAALLRLDGVVSATVIENDTDEYVNELPPHCVACYVNAGINEHTPEDERTAMNQLIAETIFSKKGGGIYTHGSTAVELKDERGEVNSIVRFTHTDELALYFEITAELMPGADKDEVRGLMWDNINGYIAGLDKEPFVFNRLYGKCYVDGVRRIISITEAEGQPEGFIDIDDASHEFDAIDPKNDRSLILGGVTLKVKEA